jgi:5-methylcytosine-specific restriction protein A
MLERAQASLMYRDDASEPNLTTLYLMPTSNSPVRLSAARIKNTVGPKHSGAHAITPDDVIRFAQNNADKQYYTFARERPFTVCAHKTGIRIDLPTNAESEFLVGRDFLVHYLEVFNFASESERRKTTLYPDKWRERSYVGSFLLEVAKGSNTQRPISADALSDLDDTPSGCAAPDRVEVSSIRIARDPEVRRFVIEKAEGRCEYCRQAGFLMGNGSRYLEAHHIISLATEGSDTVDNVIALCPAHHREAHYGRDASALEKEFLRVMKKRKWEKLSP